VPRFVWLGGNNENKHVDGSAGERRKSLDVDFSDSKSGEHEKCFLGLL